MNETKTRNRVASVPTSKTGFNWQLLAICAICCCAVMLTGLIGMVVQSGTDTRLNDVATTPNVTNSHNNYYGLLPDAIKQQLQPMTTPTPQPVVTQPQTQPQQTVVIQEQPQRTGPNIVYIRPERQPVAEDTTIVYVRPEVRQPQTRVVVIDERYERLNAEYLARKAAIENEGRVVVVN
jgi:hypothetical protein